MITSLPPSACVYCQLMDYLVARSTCGGASDVKLRRDNKGMTRSWQWSFLDMVPRMYAVVLS